MYSIALDASCLVQFLTIEACLPLTYRRQTKSGSSSTLSFSTRRIAEILGRVETLHPEEHSFILLNFLSLKNELVFAAVCVRPHQNRQGAGVRACFLFLPLST